MAEQKKPLIYIVIGEESGDQLGARAVIALKAATGGEIAFAGLAGERMQAEGLTSLFPLGDIAVMGADKHHQAISASLSAWHGSGQRHRGDQAGPVVDY